MSIVPGLLQSAQALGISPVDLATAFSYETGGTFDPTKRGPTTQWGQHRGLIQFGEQQAREYGVDWNDPVGSQLGENGAVVKYLRKTGVRPGMGLLDIYSAINAGGVGRYGASDANNGGAPGTVRDKVEQQMAGHREKALALLGGDYQPDPQHMRPAGGNMQTGLLSAFQKPEDTRSIGERLRDGAKDGSLWDALAVGFNSMRGSFADPNISAMAQSRMDRRQEQEQVNQTAEWLRQNGREDLAAAIEGGMIDGSQAFGMMQPKGPDIIEVNGQLVDKNTGQVMGDYRTPEGPDQTAAMQNYQAMIDLGVPGDVALEKAFGKGGVNVSVNNGSEVGTIPQGYELFTDPETGARSLRAIAGGPEDTSRMDAVKDSNAAIASETITTAAARAREAASGRNLGSAGTSIVGAINPLSDSAEVLRQVEVLKSNAKVENLTAMRAASPTGGALGSVTEKESQMLADKSGALDPNSPNFLRDLDDFERTLLRIVHGKEAGDIIFEQTRSSAPQADTSDDDLLRKYGG